MLVKGFVFIRVMGIFVDAIKGIASFWGVFTFGIFVSLATDTTMSLN